MRRTYAIFGTLAAIGSASADDVSWKAAVPLWKSLSNNGQVIAAGPAPAWLGEKTDPPAKLGFPPRPAPEGLPRPRELPDDMVNKAGPVLPSLPAPTKADAPLPGKRVGKESFASFRTDGPSLPAPKPAR